jgi:hypothetical protein
MSSLKFTTPNKIDDAVVVIISQMLGVPFANSQMTVDTLPDRYTKRVTLEITFPVTLEISRSSLDAALLGKSNPLEIVGVVKESLATAFEKMPLFNEVSNRMAEKLATAEKTIETLQEMIADLQQYKTHFNLEMDLRRAGR